MTQVAYDAGVLVAADRNDRSVWAEHPNGHGQLRVRLAPVSLPGRPTCV
jgi:hypothetical protein